jgi:hypothetical protein
MLQLAYRKNMKKMEDKLTNEINLHAKWLNLHKKDLDKLI